MVNPLARMTAHHRAIRTDSQRREKVDVPRDDSALGVLQLALRRMRMPVLLVVLVFSISVIGLSLMPGVDAEGNPHRLTLFDSLYFMSYTATTIGFGEIPYSFTIYQRMWVMGSIFASVASWTFAITSMFSLLSAPGFRAAMTSLRIQRVLRRTRDPFYVVVGNGQTGAAVVEGLMALHRDVVVVDRDPERLERLTMGQTTGSVLGLHGDARKVETLGSAGLGNSYCHGVLAMTDDDETNLAVVMSVNLLRPDVPVIARSNTAAMADRMRDFFPEHVVNPLDEYGKYLTMQLKRPHTHRLSQWLMNTPGTPIGPYRPGLADGRWVVVSDGEFGQEVARDLASAGLDVTRVDPVGELVDLTDVVGVVVGAESDIVNMSVAARVRAANPDCYLALRQKSLARRATTEAFAPDSVFVPAELVAHEAMAYLISPNYWHFVRKVMEREDEWAEEVLSALQRRVGRRTPEAARLDVSREHAPALHAWLQGNRITLGQLLTHPETDRTLPVYAAVLSREGERIEAPQADLPLQVGDIVMVLGTPGGLADLTSTVHNSADVEYLATGVRVPRTLVFRALRRLRRGGPGAPGPDSPGPGGAPAAQADGEQPRPRRITPRPGHRPPSSWSGTHRRRSTVPRRGGSGGADRTGGTGASSNRG